MRVIGTDTGATGRIDMTIDAAGLSKVMTILTDLYSRPIDAVVREVATNACDSHRKAGTDDPVRIVIDPRDDGEYFVVADTGVGMSREEILGVLSQYGNSTKGDSDIEAGQLGLGAKAPLTYADSFEVEARKDGFVTLARVYKSELGTGAIEIVSHGPNVDGGPHSGVTVSVPINPSDHGTFLEAITNFIRLRHKDDVPITFKNRGEDVTPANIAEEASELWSLEDVILTKHLTAHFVVMNGVAYAVDGNQTENVYLRDWYFVAYVKPGAVDFTPSRESLHYTAKTVEVINDVLKRIREQAEERIFLSAVNADPFEALSDVIDMASSGPIHMNTSWAGLEPYFPTPPTIPDQEARLWEIREDNGTIKRSSRPLHFGVNVGAMTSIAQGRMLAIRDFPYKTVSHKHIEAIQKWMRQNRVKDRSPIYLYPKSTNWGMFDTEFLISWNDMPKVPRKKRGSGPSSSPVAAPYEAYWFSNRNGNAEHWYSIRVTAEDLKKSVDGEALPVSGIYWDDYGAPRRHELRADPPLNTLVIALPGNRAPKFKRENPTVQHISELRDAVASDLKKGWASLTTAQKIGSIYSVRWGRDEDPTKIPEIKDPLLKSLSELPADWRGKEGKKYGRIFTGEAQQLMEPYFQKYRLVLNQYGRTFEITLDNVLYLNAKFDYCNSNGVTP